MPPISPDEEALMRDRLDADLPRNVGTITVLDVAQGGELFTIISISCPTGCCIANYALPNDMALDVSAALAASVAEANQHSQQMH